MANLDGRACSSSPGARLQRQKGLRPNARTRGTVETGLDKFVKPGREREKYRWAAHYHNYVAVEFFQRDDQVITEKLTALESEFPRQFRRLP